MHRARRPVRGWRRAGSLGVAGAATYLGTISASGTLSSPGYAVLLIVALTFAVGFRLRRTSVSAVVWVTPCALAIVAAWVLPIVADFVEATVNEKVGSASFNDRSSSKSDSYEILLDTSGLGVGLGASRASSFFPGLLSTTGLIGNLLLAAAVVCLIRRSADIRQYRPVVWAADARRARMPSRGTLESALPGRASPGGYTSWTRRSSQEWGPCVTAR